MAPRRVAVTGSKPTGWRSTCEHCGKGFQVSIVPKDGETFTVPRRVLNWLGRMAEQLDEMGVKTVYLESLKDPPKGDEVGPIATPQLPGVAPSQ